MKKGFTIAEVLITLVIIGVVSALVIPSVVQNGKEKQYDAARKKVLMTIGQAGRSMASNGSLTNAINAKDFVENYFSRYVKIAKTCENSNLEDCGLSNEITTIDNDTLAMPRTIGSLGERLNDGGYDGTGLTSYGFTLINGYAINLFYYPKCNSTNKNQTYARQHVCINAIYDMNGLKEPNKVGKDVGFVTVMYPDASSVAVAPKPYKEDIKSSAANAGRACSNIDKNLFVPASNEFLSMAYNNKLIGNMTTGAIAWPFIKDSEFHYSDFFQYVISSDKSQSGNSYLRCVWK